MLSRDVFIARAIRWSTVATIVSQALVRARRYADEQERAVVLRSALLPGNPGDVGSLEVHVGYEPADLVRGLGSDWCDVMTLATGLRPRLLQRPAGDATPAKQIISQ